MSLKNQIINVVCEKIVFPGRSLCRCEDGLVLFTDWLLPKETAEVLVVRDKKTYRDGILKSIVLESKDRINPRCSSFGICGGCYFQNLSYENQLILKQEYLKELLSFTDLNISTIIPSPLQWYYRNKMEFSFFNSRGTVDLGLHEKGNFNKYVPVPPCYICDKDFIKVVDIVKHFAKESKLFAYDNKKHEGFFRHVVLRKAQNNNQLLVNIVTNESTMGQDVLRPIVNELSVFVDSLYWTINSRRSDAVVVNKLILLHGKPCIREKLNVGSKDFYFNISPFSFFQTSSKGTEILYNQVLKLLKPSKHDTLLDLYCGTGTIGLSVACSVKEVVGVDIIPEAIAIAKENLILNNINNAQFFVASCQDWVDTTEYNFDLVVVDPPRAGLTEKVINFLLFSKAKRIVYVSCNPSTLGRDLQIIIESGKYNLTEIVLVDVFAHTSHVEVVVALEPDLTALTKKRKKHS
ncbi:MAG: 23S rRNA (uracil(1939)-C(5))-methyltransferase RlmD [Endomicrobium sp.]|jgi:23S rRNA (uracil-5-)-methyltransferase RumA|nr:23S rRNA (uracil(1939)-C(5))-methyltransferase RlmD [Endomicrobium sp.]